MCEMKECCDQIAKKCDEQFMSDICLAEPYLEFDFSCDGDDPFNGSTLRESLNETLPSPSKFSRSESTPPAPMETRCCRGAIVSLVKPHKILAISSDISSMAEFTSDQICGRSINVLCGPRTDVSSLNAAIKNTALGQSSTIDTVLSSSTGADLHVTVTLSPYHRPSDRSLGGCLLQIDCIHISDVESCGPAKSSKPVLLLEDFCLFSDPSSSLQPSPKSALQRRLRREANLAAGLDNEAERRRQQQGSLLLGGLPCGYLSPELPFLP